MSGIILWLNEVETLNDGLRVECPYCGSSTVRRWGSGTRSVYDTKPINTVIFRFFCVDCSRTFRYYPQGVDRSPLSRRIRRLAAMLWLMEVSTRDVEEIFDSLGVSINRMTVWREGQKLVEELNQQKLLTPENHFILHRSNGAPEEEDGNLSFLISLDSTSILKLGKLNCSVTERVTAWLRAVMEDQEVEIMNLDDVDYSTAEMHYLPQ